MRKGLVIHRSNFRANSTLMTRFGSRGKFPGPEIKTGARMRPRKARQRNELGPEYRDERGDFRDSRSTSIALHEPEVQTVTW